MDEEFGEQLRVAVGEFVRRGREQSGSTSASVGETLGVLAREGALSIADLARRRRVRHQSQSATIAELREAALVDRVADPHDRRGWLIVLTDEGRRMITASRADRARWIAEAALRLDPDERRILERIPGILTKMARD